MSLFNKPFFSPQEAEAIQQSIVEAERLCSGEIRVHIDRNCKGNVLDKAQAVFTQLGMQSTQLRNGVLIYLVPKQKLMAIIGDVGIHEKVGQDFFEGKITLPIILLFQNIDFEEKKLLNKIFKKNIRNKDDFNKIIILNLNQFLC